MWLPDVVGLVVLVHSVHKDLTPATIAWTILNIFASFYCSINNNYIYIYKLFILREILYNLKYDSQVYLQPMLIPNVTE